jgi:hypothetical protein
MKTVVFFLVSLFCLPASATFAYKRTITIDHTKVGGTSLTNYTVLVSGIYGYLAGVASGGLVTSASGYDIGFYADAGLTTKLAWETERYVATTGEVDYFVLVPSVSSSTDTVIYMAYTDATITTDQSNPTGSWDSSYVAIVHLPNGSSLSVADSTAINTITNTSLGAVAGKIDGGASLNGSTSLLNMGTNAALNPTALTVSLWVNWTSSGNNFSATYSKYNGGSGEYQVFVRNSGAIGTYTNVGGAACDPGTARLSTGTWYLIQSTYSSATGLTGYVNGASDCHTATSSPLNSNSAPSVIGADQGVGGRQFGGSIDEVRVSNVARSAGQMLADYNNQSSPGTFYTVGSQVPPPPSPGIGKSLFFVSSVNQPNMLPLARLNKERLH